MYEGRGREHRSSHSPSCLLNSVAPLWYDLGFSGCSEQSS